jgi:hypothetical protein
MTSSISEAVLLETDLEEDAAGDIQDFNERYSTYPTTTKMMNLIIYTQLSFDLLHQGLPIRIVWCGEKRVE